MNFKDKIKDRIKINNSLVCIGIDTDVAKIPQHLLNDEEPIFSFNRSIIDATYNLVCSYKLNIAYYAGVGISGLAMLQKTITYLHHKYPDIPVILDTKRADIGSTASHYAKEVFDVFSADAITVNPYLGSDGIEPFLEYKDKGIIVLCRTSNKGASDFQDLLAENEPLYLHVAKKIVEWNKKNDNCLMAVAATWPDELKKIRELAPEMFFLVLGIGAQGGDLEKTLEYGLTKEKSGLLIHSARAIIYASNARNFADKAREETQKLKEQINKFR